MNIFKTPFYLSLIKHSAFIFVFLVVFLYVIRVHIIHIYLKNDSFVRN